MAFINRLNKEIAPSTIPRGGKAYLLTYVVSFSKSVLPDQTSICRGSSEPFCDDDFRSLLRTAKILFPAIYNVGTVPFVTPVQGGLQYGAEATKSSPDATSIPCYIEHGAACLTSLVSLGYRKVRERPAMINCWPRAKVQQLMAIQSPSKPS